VLGVGVCACTVATQKAKSNNENVFRRMTNLLYSVLEDYDRLS